MSHFLFLKSGQYRCWTAAQICYLDSVVQGRVAGSVDDVDPGAVLEQALQHCQVATGAGEVHGRQTLLVLEVVQRLGYRYQQKRKTAVFQRSHF